MAKITPTMKRVLTNLAEGRRATHGFPGGQSMSGGLSGTFLGLRRRGFLDARGEITGAGLAALSTHRSEQREGK